MLRRQRRSIRIPGFDYSQPGAYYVTICSYHRQPIFGRIVEGEVLLSDEGGIVEEEWLMAEMLRSEIRLDEFVIMPNHLHGIVIFNETSTHLSVGAHGHAPLPGHEGSLHRPLRTLGSLVARFKGSVTRRARMMVDDPTYIVWQRNYYEHVIRNEIELNQIRRYIVENPLRWPQDRYITHYYTRKNATEAPSGVFLDFASI
jgi:REP element-mobilizing transposase RayT